MQAGALLPIVIFGVVASSVGIRLVRVWWRTRALPEFCVGFGMASVALGCMPLTALGRSPQLVTTPVGRALFCAGIGMATLTFILVWLFDWRVFRPQARWAAVLFGVASCSLVGCWAGMAHAELTGETLPDIMWRARPFTGGLLFLLCSSYAWGAVESLSYWGTMRRRMSIGLVDPVLADRFLLWGIANLTTALLCAVLLYAVLRGMVIARDPAPLYVIAAAGIVMSVTWYLTFFAPERYRRWVRERASRVGGPGASSRPA